ncbi:MAG: DNA adenine methyltransferase YhdJ [Verrucomicrobia bacterium ADurb.Bin122]|nr:MAG: DNA adenine methyltransferase YhdJ [Verrucomicrobia bacterium ADurb.Bin122]
MAVKDQVLTDDYALYCGDCCDVLTTLPDASVHMSLYSPPFCGLYNYSSSERDLSNCRSYDEFFQHYEFVVRELFRTTLPGRISGVHCMDVPKTGANAGGGLADFPGDIIRLHERVGFQYCARYHIWKEPLGVRNRTMAKGLAHKQVVEDSTLCDVASADYLLMFRRKGQNTIPVAHPTGLDRYAGAREIPRDVRALRGHKGKQTENRYSHWIWRQYASAFWDDVRLERVMPYTESREADDERHVHPLQLDVIERAVVLWSNPGEVVLTPFMGVGSEVYGAVLNGRKGVGIELKPSYYKQAVRNVAAALADANKAQLGLFHKEATT